VQNEKLRTILARLRSGEGEAAWMAGEKLDFLAGREDLPVFEKLLEDDDIVVREATA
jgi:hypothetical protein